MKPILFAGGDRRTVAAVSWLERQGYETETYALLHRTLRTGPEPLAIVLPYPCLKEGKLNAPGIPDPPTLEETLRETGVDPRRVPAIGGPLLQNPFTNYTDLSLSEELKLRNAVTTAEGALALLIGETPRALSGASALVVGYGAIGKRLSDLLAALGTHVTVAARKPADRIAATLKGYGTQDTATLSLKGMDFLINTVPFRLIDSRLLKEREPELSVLELASPPYGGAPELFRELGIRYIAGPALPGKVAPLTAGEDLAKTLIGLLPPEK